MEWTPVLTVLTEYGLVGALGIHYRDMVSPQLTASGNLTASTTTTITDSAATFTGNNDASDTVSVLGCYVRFLNVPAADKPGSADWSQPYRITTVNSATQITVTPAMPSAPPAATAYVIGAIPDAVYKTPQLALGGAIVRKDVRDAAIEFAPSGRPMTCRMSVSKDRRGYDPATVTASETPFSSTATRNGIDINMGGGLDAGRVGAHMVPINARGFQYLQLAFDATGIDNPIVIDAIGFGDIVVK
jgi:hypothetical protein